MLIINCQICIFGEENSGSGANKSSPLLLEIKDSLLTEFPVKLLQYYQILGTRLFGEMLLDKDNKCSGLWPKAIEG